MGACRKSGDFKCLGLFLLDSCLMVFVSTSTFWVNAYTFHFCWPSRLCCAVWVSAHYWRLSMFAQYLLYNICFNYHDYMTFLNLCVLDELYFSYHTCFRKYVVAQENNKMNVLQNNKMKKIYMCVIYLNWKHSWKVHYDYS